MFIRLLSTSTFVTDAMALYARLLSKNVFCPTRHVLGKRSLSSINWSRVMSTVSTSQRFEKNPFWDEKEGLNFETRNKRLGRPLSPSLSAYRFENNMVASMGHRITGMAVYAMLFGLAAGAAFLPAAYPHYIGMLADLHPSALAMTAAKFLIVYPFAWHATTGVRHLITDSGYWLTIKGVNYTSWAVMAVSALFALHLATL